MSQLLKKAREVFTEVQKDLKENVTPGIINTLMEDVKNAFGKLPSDDKKTLSKRYQTLLDRLKSKRKNQN